MVQFFAKHKITPQIISLDFLIFAKLAKFRQIWSHWLDVGIHLRQHEREQDKF